MYTEEHSFDPETVSKVFKTAFKSDNSKVNKEALQLCAEFFRLFVVGKSSFIAIDMLASQLLTCHIEAVHRSSDEQDVMSESKGSIEVEHLERVLPQLLLDF
ncbi:hypothetical protein BD560DRAFT_444053 [Blakeslea trispora]|nr:hypothetical protein BD560DRAFT_444053 [Blakeslea trispora]